MAERLEVSGFAGIKILDMEVKPITVLIGPQATGKSICAKLLLFFKGLVWKAIEGVVEGKTKRQIDADHNSRFLSYFPADAWGSGVFSIKYSVADFEVVVSRKGPESAAVSLKFSERYRHTIAKARRALKKERDMVAKAAVNKRRSRFVPVEVRGWMIEEEVSQFLHTTCAPEASFAPMFIPAGRSFFSVLQQNVFTFLSRNIAMDPFLQEFGTLYEQYKRVPLGLQRQIEESPLGQQCEAILNGKLEVKGGDDYFRMADGRRIRVFNASSGQQEALPLVRILTTMASFPTTSSGHAVILEEPEAHLYPIAQKSITEALALLTSASPSPLRLLVTTHSPYILSTFNNLAYAGILRARLSEDYGAEVDKVVPQGCQVVPGNLCAYFLDRGRCKAIIDPDTGLVDAYQLDSASAEISSQFDALLRIEAASKVIEEQR